MRIQTQEKISWGECGGTLGCWFFMFPQMEKHLILITHQVKIK